MVCYMHLFGILRENALCAHDITYVGHYEKSLCSDNDPPCYSREIKRISSDWIALLRRLLINDNITMAPPVALNCATSISKCVSSGWTCNVVLATYANDLGSNPGKFTFEIYSKLWPMVNWMNWMYLIISCCLEAFPCRCLSLTFYHSFLQRMPPPAPPPRLIFSLTPSRLELEL